MRPLLFSVELKVMSRKDLVSLMAVGRVEMPYRMIVRESRLTSRLQQCLGSYMETEMRAAERCLSSQENMGSRRAESLGIGYLECRWWNEALCLLK